MKKNRKLKGSVLFTVVSVMALLIIFLGGTLALAASSNKRAHRSYSTSQAEITAKSAINSFVEAMIRDEAIVGAIQNLPIGTPIHPQVIIGDNSLGRLVRYEGDGTPVYDELTVELINPLDTATKSYAYYDDGSGVMGWHEVVQLKISATVRVGQEEKTVSAYIRKKGADSNTEPGGTNPVAVKGLQTAGGASFTTTKGHYTGAIAFGLEYAITDSDKPYAITNSSDIYTSSNFINGSFATGANLNFKLNDDSIGNGTVILGNYLVDNIVHYDINYTLPDNYTQKDIPYLFVRDALYEVSNMQNFVQGNGSPFNMFVGTINLTANDFSFKGTDLYLMDTVDTGKVYELKDSNGNISKTLTKGKNVVGDHGGSKLEKWTQSVIEKQDPSTQFESIGGSIYCKGDLELKAVTVEGDVRVEGNCTIGSGVTINGNLVVGGAIIVNSNPNVNGNIYNNSVGDYVLKAGYGTEDIYPTSITPSAANGWKQWAFYHPTTGEFLGYADWNGATTKVYVNSAGDYVSESEATEFVASSNPQINGKAVKSLSELETDLGYNSDNIYPSSMTKDKIYGLNLSNAEYERGYSATFDEWASDTDNDGFITFPEQIIKTLKEAQDNIGYDAINASWDSRYLTELPNGTKTVYDNISDKGTDTVYRLTNAGTYDETTRSDAINAGFLYANSYLSGEYLIKPKGSITILLDNMSMGDATLIIDDTDPTMFDPSSDTINIFIKGNVTVGNRSRIVTKSINDKVNSGAISESDAVNINLYSYNSGDPDNPTKLCFYNNGLVSANALAPYLKLSGDSTGGTNASVAYSDKNGNVLETGMPHWIGNAMVKATEGFNDFTLYYTDGGSGGSGGSGGGSGGSGGGSIPTSLGFYEIGYFSAY